MMNTETFLLISRDGDAYHARGEYGLGTALWYKSERLWNCERPHNKRPLRNPLSGVARGAALLLTGLMRPARAR